MQKSSFLYYTHARAFLIIYYTRVRGITNSPRNPLYALKTLKTPQNTPKISIFQNIENQSITKKMHFYVHFFAKIFGQFKNLLYLCIRFRSKMGVAPKEHKSNMIFERMSIITRCSTRTILKFNVECLVFRVFSFTHSFFHSLNIITVPDNYTLINRLF